MAGHGHNMKNEDGTVNLAGIQGHVADLKAKYAQNARNYEANTGKPFDETHHSHSGSGSSLQNNDGDKATNSGAQGHGEVGQSRGAADYDGPDGFADRDQPQGDSGQTRDGAVGDQSGRVL